VSVPLALLLFLASLTVTLGAARLFARRLDRLGVKFGLSEALIGLLTALAADGPEISSALFALIRGQHSVGVGVLVGSNTFNLAAMLGISALLASRVRADRATLALEGSVGGAITLIAVAVLLGWIAAGVAALLGAAVLAPYLVKVIGGGEKREQASARRRASGSEDRHDPTHHLLGLIVFDVVVIVAGSAGMVQTALTLGHDWHISHAVLGVVALGPLTSIPNAMTGVRLGLARRGEALVGEALNSNTLNLAAGVIAPSLFVTLTAATATAKAELWWLIGMTAVTIFLLARGDGLGRRTGVAVILMYAGFVVLALS
jgi:cation:H+ antiporter